MGEIHAVIKTNSVNGAASVLNITSSAVSQSLNKLRTEYKDPLFVRDGRGLKPTSFALQVYDQIKEALAILSNNSQIEAEFDPLTSDRVFKLAIHYDLDIIIYTKLITLLKEIAPNIKIEMIKNSDDEGDLQNTLRLRKADLIITSLELKDLSYKNDLIHKESLYVFARKNHPLLKDGAMTKEIFFEAEHAGVSMGKQTQSKLKTLSKVNLSERNVTYTTNSLLNMVFTTAQSDLFSVAYGKVYDMVKDLNIVDVYPLPFDCFDLPIYMTWHKTFEKDEGLKWLRSQVKCLLK